MNAACERRDADLLMLAHGELTPGRALSLRAHLLVCARCRDRYRQLDALSSSLASTLRNPSLGARAFRPAPTTAWASLGLLALFVSSLSWIVVHSFFSAPTSISAALPTNPPSKSCTFHTLPETVKNKILPEKTNHSTIKGDEWIEDDAGRPHLVPRRILPR